MSPSPARVLVTGAGGAIGAALARAMRSAWPSAELALLDRDTGTIGPLAAELGGASAHAYDLRDVDGLPSLVAALGPLDGLVNCAGVMRVRGVASCAWDVADELLQVDLLAPLRLQSLVAAGLVERGRPGVIVNVSSMAGRVPLRGCAYYGAAKAGLAMASEIARAELAPRGIRVLTVYPGPVRSALEQSARAEYGEGLTKRLVPTGDPAELAAKILTTLERGEPRVIYPRWYELGWSALGLASRFALTYGPAPLA